MPESSPLLWRALFSAITLGRDSLSILIYHRVRTERDPMRPGDPTATEFAWQMGLLARHFNVLPLSEALLRLHNGTLPRRAASITFDDGYADNFRVALPILERARITATVFVASGYLDGGRMWNDTVVEGFRRHPGPALDLRPLGLPHYSLATVESRRRNAHDAIRRAKYLSPGQRGDITARIEELCGILPDDLMLTTRELRGLAGAGIEIGGHTVSHPILSQLEPQEAAREIQDNKEDLEHRTGTAIHLFAYPNGQPEKDFTDVHCGLVKHAGYRAAVTTRPGACSTRMDPFLLPRFTPWDKSSGRYLLRMAINAGNIHPPRDEHLWQSSTESRA